MTNKLILVTGGAGYIGSHTVLKLIEANYKVVVLDNLMYGHRHIVEDVLNVPLIVGKVGNRKLVEDILSGSHPACKGELVTAVMHFAAYAYVNESVNNPSKYYQNNLGDSLILLEALKNEKKRRGDRPIPLVFSSTCATYGTPDSSQIPITEKTRQSPINPYGRSKWMVEQIIIDYWKAYRMPGIIFRYFNAAGADPSGNLGEIHRPETHLIPLAIATALNKKSYLKIFGDDYPTEDGTCIRDYIHVNDLADAHIKGLRLVLKQSCMNIFNLGIGKGYSVKEVVDTVNEVTGLEIPIKIEDRRQGDPPILVAVSDKARKELDWEPRFTKLSTIVRHAWNWHRKQ